MAFYMITNYLAAGSGQFILPLGDPAGYELFCVASIIYSLALVPVLLTRASARSHPRRNARAFPTCGKFRRWGSSAPGGRGRQHQLPRTRAGVRPQRGAHGPPDRDVHGGGDLRGPASCNGRWDGSPIGSIAAPCSRGWRSGPRRRPSASCSHTGGTFTGMIVLIAAYGGLSFAVYSLCTAHTNDFAPPEKLVQTASGLLIAYGLGASIGPVVTSSLMSGFGRPPCSWSIPGPPGCSECSRSTACSAALRSRRRSSGRSSPRRAGSPRDSSIRRCGSGRSRPRADDGSRTQRQAQPASPEPAPMSVCRGSLNRGSFMTEEIVPAYRLRGGKSAGAGIPASCVPD